MENMLNYQFKINFRSYIYILIALLISVIFFLRGQWFGLNFNFSQLIVMISILLFLSLLLNYGIKGLIALPPLDICLLTLFFIINPLISIVIHQQSLFPSALLISELMLNIIIYYVFYIVISRNYISIHKLLPIIVCVSSIISISMIVDVSGLNTFRRYVFFSTGVNLLAHSIAISSFIILYWLTKSKTIKFTILKVLLLSVNLIALVLTGSRSGLIAFILSSILLIIFNAYKINIRRSFVWIIFIFISTLVIAWFFNNENSFQMLFNRFDLSSISLSETGRLNLWIDALSYIDILNLFVGSPWLYEVYNIGLIHPHNFFISMLVYTGLIPTLLFILILFRVSMKLLYLEGMTNISKVFYLLVLLIPIIYSSVSGNFTRIYSLFVVLGLLDGLITLYNRQNKNRESIKVKES